MKDFRTIIWDWNGTLLNDTSICLESINLMLSKRNIPKIDMKTYQQVFTFPVRDYYQAVGFDFSVEPFEELAHEFIMLYKSRLHKSELADDAIQSLEYFKDNNMQQYILSAMQQNALEKSIRALNIYDFFDIIKGIGDDYAAGKASNGKWLIDYYGLDPKELCLIGDSTHDAEVAQLMGCECLLISSGHQSHKRLENTGETVLRNLSELLHYIKS